MVAGSMCRNTFRGNFELDATFVTAIELHFGRFTNHHKIGFDARVNFDKGIGCNSIAPFFHISEIPGSPAIKQTKVAGERHAIDHARGRAFFVASTPRKQHAIFDFSFEWIPFPFIRIADAYCIDVGIEDDRTRSVANAPHDVAHFIEAHLVETKFAHFFGDPFAHWTDLRFKAWNGANFAHKSDEIISVFLGFLVNLLEYFLCDHWFSFFCTWAKTRPEGIIIIPVKSPVI